MLPTFITTNTTTIKSNFIALDLGGTGFRIYMFGTIGEIIHKIVTKIPENMKKGSIENLMFFVAESLTTCCFYKTSIQSKSIAVNLIITRLKIYLIGTAGEETCLGNS
ncbi:unnamed protein product [Meloidogyne enterolobii]|uniref:Hexokinase N-terminal domain-containing protein n=2 Tax=Meloidogyne enterolobii TaxID=390850 RepID=A0A6V7U237_MELEN|nr:unnamed protein product [Meloidogyne enterolobii]